MNFVDFIQELDRMGISEVMLPFLLVFVIVFAVLQKTHILGKDKKNYNVIVSLIMGLAVVIPHVTRPGSEMDVVPIINAALPNISVIAIAVIMLLLIIGLFGAKLKLGGQSLSLWIVIAALLIVTYIFGSAAGWGWQIPAWLSFLNDPDTQAFVIIVLVFAIIIWLITREPRKPDEKGKWFKDLGKIVENVDE